MRNVALIVLSIATLGGGVAFAQSDPAARERAASATRVEENPEEVIVRGRRLTELRAEVEITRERAYGNFNEINSNDDFDVYCRAEGRTGTRSTDRVCRAQFENRISAQAASEYMRTLAWNCPTGPTGEVITQDCLFSGYGQNAADSARAIEGQVPSMRDRMNEEILRLANQDDRFAQAILDWYEASQQLEAARKRGRGD